VSDLAELIWSYCLGCLSTGLFGMPPLEVSRLGAPSRRLLWVPFVLCALGYPSGLFDQGGERNLSTVVPESEVFSSVYLYGTPGVSMILTEVLEES